MQAQPMVIDYQHGEMCSRIQYSSHRPYLLAALSLFPVVACLVLLRWELTRLQWRAGSGILAGTPQGLYYSSLENNGLVLMFFLEGVLSIVTVTLVVTKTWSPTALLMLFINAFAICGGLFVWFMLSCEASP